MSQIDPSAALACLFSLVGLIVLATGFIWWTTKDDDSQGPS